MPATYLEITQRLTTIVGAINNLEVELATVESPEAVKAIREDQALLRDELDSLDAAIDILEDTA